MLRLAQKAFYPGPIPFPLLHIDTGFKFAEMLEFRDRIARELDLDRHVDQLELHRLELGDARAELHALFGVLGGRVVTGLRQTDGQRAYADASAVERVEELMKAATAFAEHVFSGNARVGERQLARV